MTSAPGVAYRTAADDVEHELEALLRARRHDAHAYGPQFERLWALAEDLCRDGKRIRPRLFLDAYAAMSQHPPAGQAHTALVQVAVAVEVLHTAFLLHDDVIDGDELRRGHPNLVARLRDEALATGSTTAQAAHWGSTGGILMGDLLLTEAHLIFARLDVEAAVHDRLLDLLRHTISESVAGEQLDVAFSDAVVRPDLAGVLGASRYKTATYSFELPLRAAAALAGGDEYADRQLAQVGRVLGLVFQLQDDLLSAFGEPGRHGKDAYADLRQGKETAIIAAARDTPDWPRIAPLFGGTGLTVAQGRELSRLLDRCGARAFVEALVADEITMLRSLLVGRHPATLPVTVIDALVDRLERRVA